MLEMVQGISFNAAFSNSSLATAGEIIEKSHIEALGRARVSSGGQLLQLQELEMQASERKIMEERALAEFISLNAIPGDNRPVKAPPTSITKADRVG